jgi:hypothetical protein
MLPGGESRLIDLHALICWWYVNMILTDALLVAVVYVDPSKSSRTYTLASCVLTCLTELNLSPPPLWPASVRASQQGTIHGTAPAGVVAEQGANAATTHPTATAAGSRRANELHTYCACPMDRRFTCSSAYS